MAEIGGKRPSPGASPEPGSHEWRPIETAPKDGTHVILCEGDVVGEAHFAAEDRGWWWGDYSSTDYLDRQCYPTHWMPLPEPPRG